MDNSKYKKSVDAYSMLGVNQNASLNEIKAAYKTLAVIYHPDKNKDSKASEIFIKIKEAYEVLQNPVSREEYDLSRSESKSISQILRAEKHSRDFYASRLAAKEKHADATGNLQKRSKAPVVRLYNQRNEKSASEKHNKGFDLDKKFYQLHFQWSDPQTLFKDYALKFLFQQFGEVNEIFVDNTLRKGHVEFKQIEECEKAAKYFESSVGGFKASLFVSHKRQENMEKYGKLKINRIGLDSDTLNILMKNQ